MNFPSLAVKESYRIRCLALFFLNAAFLLWPLHLGLVIGRYPVNISLLIFVTLGIFGIDYRHARILFKRDWLPYLTFLFINLIAYLFFMQKHGLIFGYPDIRHLSGSVLLFLVLTTFMRGRESYENFFFTFLLASSVLITLLIGLNLLYFKSLFLYPYIFKDHYLTFAPVGKNQLVLFLVFLFPFAYSYFSHRRSFLGLWMLLSLGGGLFYCFSRMGVIAALISLILFCVIGHVRKRCLIQLSILFSLCLGLYIFFDIGPQTYLDIKFKGQNEVSREIEPEGLPNDLRWTEFSLFDYSKEIIQGLKERPFMGNGLGSFEWDNPIYSATGTLVRRPSTHNEYTQILYELGLVGLMLFLWIGLYSVKVLLRDKKNLPQQHLWLWDGQMVSLLTVFVALNSTNAYGSPLFWFLMAGTLLFHPFRVRDLS